MAGPTQPLRCVRCGGPLLPAYMSSCPRCGLPVRVSVEEQAQAPGEAPGGWDAGGAPGHESQGYGQQPGFGSGTYGQPAGPSYPLYGQPAAPSTPYYGQPAGPSMPLYGQAAPPSVPFYGQPAGPSVPMPGYGQPAGPSVPYYGQPPYAGMPPMGGEQPRRHTGLIAALVIALVLVVGGASAAIAVLSHGGQQSATTGGGASATATATAAATATPGSGSAPGSVLYHSALTGSVFGWPARSGCTPSADGYHVKADVSCFAPTQDLADFDLKVTAQQMSGNASNPYGVTFRGSATAGDQISSVYAFMADDQGDYAFFKVSGGSSTMLQRGQTAAMHHGGANSFEVRAKGSHFTLLVNGTQVTQADDASIASGKCGLQGYDGSDIRFTNLTITSL